MKEGRRGFRMGVLASRMNSPTVSDYRATRLMAGRIASSGMLPGVDPLPHLKCSRPGFGGDGHEADQHGNTGRVGGGGVGALRAS